MSSITPPDKCPNPECGYDGGDSETGFTGHGYGADACRRCGVIWWQHALAEKDKRIAELEAECIGIGDAAVTALRDLAESGHAADAEAGEADRLRALGYRKRRGWWGWSTAGGLRKLDREMARFYAADARTRKGESDAD